MNEVKDGVQQAGGTAQWHTELPPKPGYYLGAWQQPITGKWFVSELWYNDTAGWSPSRGYLGQHTRDASSVNVAAWMPVPAYQPGHSPPPDDLPAGLSRVYRQYGKYAHLSSSASYGPDHSSKWGDGKWLGTGSQQEYDEARRLPLCPECKRRWALT